MSAYAQMTCGPCADTTPHRYTGDFWHCVACDFKRKDATITALADALWTHGWASGGAALNQWHSRMCPQSLPPAAAPCTCAAYREALRLAVRFP